MSNIGSRNKTKKSGKDHRHSSNDSPRESSSSEMLSIGSSQYMLGSTSNTSYSSTSGSIVNRKPDNLSLVKNASSWYAPAEKKDLGVVLEESNEDSPVPRGENDPKGSILFDEPALGETTQSIWYEIKDLKTKKLFYYNRETGVSQWNRPENSNIMSINQQGFAVIIGNGLLEKDYLYGKDGKSGYGINPNAFINAKNHVYDPIKDYQKDVFNQEEQTITGSSPVDSENSMFTSIGAEFAETSSLQLETYIKKNYNFYRRGLFYARTSYAKIASYKPIPIRMPLLKLDSRYKRSAIAMNVNILIYVQRLLEEGQNIKIFLGKQREVRHLLGIVYNDYYALRNEVYCQVLKCMNTSIDEVATRAWDLLAILCGTVAPSEELAPYIFQECTIASGSTHHIQLAQSCKKMLKKIVIEKRRTEVPTNAEIYSIIEIGCVSVRVFLVDGSYAMVDVPAGCLVGEIVKEMIKRLGLHDYGQFFALYEDRGDNENLLDMATPVLDVLSKWQYLYDEAAKKKKGQTQRKLCHFIFHLRLYVPFDMNSSLLKELVFIQGVHDVFNGKYPCSEMDYVTLLAIYKITMSKPIDDEELMRMIPSQVFDSGSIIHYNEKLKVFVEKLKDRTREWCVNAFLEYIMNWELYGCSYYFVEPIGRKDMSDECYLAIGKHGAYIVDRVSKMIQRHVPFDSIPSWNYTETSFVVYVGSFVRQEKIIFVTKSGKEINDHLHEYVTYLSSDMNSKESEKK